jgi:LysR family glycine cleavage system transcriptional activator
MAKKRDFPLGAAHAFAMAGKLQSMQAAGLALGVSASAISHQVAALEEWVGAPLFLRRPRKLYLTPAGDALAQALGKGFDHIETALADARSTAQDRKLHISALPLFTNLWLIPRLEQFKINHPDLAIEIDTSNKIANFETDNVDIAIRNARVLPGDLHARKLMDLKLVPLCSPKLADHIKAPDDLAKATLIHLQPRTEAWAFWFSQNGFTYPKPVRELTVDSLSTGLEAAAQGNGVILGLSPIIWDSPLAQNLVTPFPALTPSGGAYFMVYRRADRSRVIVRAFADWLAETMRRDIRRLAGLARQRGI